MKALNANSNLLSKINKLTLTLTCAIGLIATSAFAAPAECDQLKQKINQAGGLHQAAKQCNIKVVGIGTGTGAAAGTLGGATAGCITWGAAGAVGSLAIFSMGGLIPISFPAAAVVGAGACAVGAIAGAVGGGAAGTAAGAATGGILTVPLCKAMQTTYNKCVSQKYNFLTK